MEWCWNIYFRYGTSISYCYEEDGKTFRIDTCAKDIQVEFTGLRPGEKIFEELLADKETTCLLTMKKLWLPVWERIQLWKIIGG